MEWYSSIVYLIHSQCCGKSVPAHRSASVNVPHSEKANLFQTRPNLVRTDGLSFISISEFSTCNYKYSNCVLNLDDFERLTNINVTKNKNILREREMLLEQTIFISVQRLMRKLHCFFNLDNIVWLYTSSNTDCTRCNVIGNSSSIQNRYT